MTPEKQPNISILIVSENREIDGFNSGFTWLDRKTPVSFILGEEVTADGLPVVYSTRPAKGDFSKTNYSPEPILQYRHELSRNPEEARVFYILGGEISILNNQGIPIDATVQLRIEKSPSISTAELVGPFAVGKEFLIAA